MSDEQNRLNVNNLMQIKTIIMALSAFLIIAAVIAISPFWRGAPTAGANGEPEAMSVVGSERTRASATDAVSYTLHVGRNHQITLDMDNYFPVFQSENWCQLLGLGVAPPLGAGADSNRDGPKDTLWVGIEEYDSNLDLFYKYALPFSTSSEIISVTYRAPGDFILQVKDGTDYFIERWLLGLPDGSRTAIRNIHTGTSLPPIVDPPTPSIVGGGPYLSRGDRTTFPSMRRIRLPYVFPVGINDISVDPDGRFLVVADGAGDVWQLQLTSIVTTPVLSQSATGFADGVTGIDYFAATGYGRCMILRSDFSNWAALVIDADNDGVFETTLQFPDEQTAHAQLPLNVVGAEGM